MAAPVWVDTERGAEDAIREISAHRLAGYDSEYSGVDVSSQSCVGRSKIDVFSIATQTSNLNPIGYLEPQSWVFDGALVTTPAVRGYLEDSAYCKVIHNRTVDEHTARNAGVRIRGGLCTLNMARWVYPWRANLVRGNFDLDSICKWRVGRGKTEEFDALFGYDDYEPFEAEATANFCLACQDFGCKKKKAPHDQKEPRARIVTRKKKVRRILELAGIRPGHPLFERYLVYAAVDAELALILYQMMLIDGREERFYPWGL
jgi:hypothetical protein